MDPFQVAGLALLVTAIVGGGLQAAGQTIPVITSPIRQGLLGILGIVLMLSGSEDVRAVALGLVKPKAAQVAAVTTVSPTQTLAPTVATLAPSATVPPTAAPTFTAAPPTQTVAPAAVPAPAVAPVAVGHWCRPTLATDAIAIHIRPSTSSQWLGTVDAPRQGQQSEATVIAWSDSLDPGSVPWLRISQVRNGAAAPVPVRGWIRSREPATPSGWVDMECSFDASHPPFPLPKIAAPD